MSVGASPGPDRGFLSELFERASARRRTVVYPEGTDRRVLEAALHCARHGLVNPVLLGDPAAVWAGLSELGAEAGSLQVLAPSDEALVRRTRSHLADRRSGRGDSEELLTALAEDPLMQAATMVAEGSVDGAVAGCVRTTADVVRAGLICIGLDSGIQTLSSSFYMVFSSGHPVGPRVLTFTDAGVVPEPDAVQLAEIASAAVTARRRIVGDEPGVAFLSYSTKGSAEGSSVTLVREALAEFRRRVPGVPADGELQGDAALDPVVAARKAPGSPVAGRANILVFPDLGAANLSYKLVQYLGGAVALGPILQGLERPMNDLSRGAVAADIVAVSCITSLQAE